MEIVSKPDMRYALRPPWDRSITHLTILSVVIDHQRRLVNTFGPCRLCLDLSQQVMGTWNRYVCPLMGCQRDLLILSGVFSL